MNFNGEDTHTDTQMEQLFMQAMSTKGCNQLNSVNFGPIWRSMAARGWEWIHVTVLFGAVWSCAFIQQYRCPSDMSLDFIGQKCLAPLNLETGSS